MKNKKKSKGMQIFKKSILSIFLVGFFTTIFCGITFAMYISEHIVPKRIVDIAGITLNLTSTVYYEDQDTYQWLELETLHGDQNRVYEELENIPEWIQNAFISIEDEDFKIHNGVDWYRTFGAAVNWIIPVSSSGFGGSTITQQLVKNVTEDDDFKVTRKITEILRAMYIEEHLTKDEILELYLNTIYLGRTAYGVTTAAQTYFGKELSELNLAECAIISGITKNPSYYDPFRFPENIKERQEVILNQMVKNGFITEAEATEAKAYELDYKIDENTQKIEGVQSYFVDALVEDVLADLMEEYGYSKVVASNMLYNSGLQIFATVNVDIQDTMESVFLDESNFPNISGTGGVLPQASMVVMDPYSGKVLGIVGGRGEKVGDRVLNRATQTRRSPGSVIKPIAVYAPAIDAGVISPISVFTDSPFNYTVNTDGWPKNQFSTFAGQMTVMDAVANSVNTVAVKTLDLLGTQSAFDFITQNLGVQLVEERVYSSGTVVSDVALSPLALGGLTDGMTVLELAASYVPFTNDGYYIEPTTYTKVLDSNGNVLLEKKPASVSAFKDSNTVYYMRQLLTGVVSYGTGVRAKVANMDTLGKTGTTQNDYDRWFVGATPYYVGATWFGYDTQQTVKGTTTNPALALWEDVFDEIHIGLPAKSFSSPSSFVSVSYCKDSGLTPTEYCALDPRGSRVTTARIASADAPSEFCPYHTPVSVCSASNGIATEFCPESMVTSMALLDLTRLYEKTIILPDEMYTVTIENEPIGTGVSPSREGAICTGILCEVHMNFDPESMDDPYGDHDGDGIPNYLDPDYILPQTEDDEDFDEFDDDDFSDNSSDPNSDVDIPKEEEVEPEPETESDEDDDEFNFSFD